jgi:hypothetical protein
MLPAKESPVAFPGCKDVAMLQNALGRLCAPFGPIAQLSVQIHRPQKPTRGHTRGPRAACVIRFNNAAANSAFASANGLLCSAQDVLLVASLDEDFDCVDSEEPLAVYPF